MKRTFLLILLLISYTVFSQKLTVKTVDFKGIKKTKQAFLKRITETKPNHVLDTIQVQKDLTVLKRLASVYNATVTIKELDELFCSVIFTIEENSTILPDVAVWTALNNRFSYRLGVNEYNLFGQNIAFGGFYQNNGYDTYAINFRAPNLFSKKLGLAINHQNWKSQEPLFFNNQTANYLYNNIATEFLGLYQMNFYHQLTFGINFFKEKYQYLTGATSPDIPQNLNVDKVLYKLLYTYDDLNYFYYYVEGFKSLLNMQYVVTENDVQNTFFIAWNDFFYFKRFGQKGNWANRFRIGLASNNDSPFAPFALDNNFNLRGVGVLVDRGTGSIVLNTEYRHTVYEKKWITLQLNGFIDAGTWRQPGGELNDFLEGKNARVFSGVGLRFISKKIYNAVFRVDYGFGLTEDSRGLVFGIGQYF